MTSTASRNSKLTMLHIFLFKKLEMSFKKGPKELYFYLYHAVVVVIVTLGFHGVYWDPSSVCQVVDTWDRSLKKSAQGS